MIYIHKAKQMKQKNNLYVLAILLISIFSFTVWITHADNTWENVITVTTNNTTNTWETNTWENNTWTINTWNTDTWNTDNWEIILVTDWSGHTQIVVTWYVAPSTWNTNTWENNTWTILPNNKDIDPADEFANALAWMYTNGLTMYNNSWDYRMYDEITREEAAKMIWQAYKVFGLDTSVVKNTSCTFTDSNLFNPTLSIHIANVCQRWLFQWANWKYLPTENLSKSQATAVLIRMIEGKMSYELQTPWWEQYYKKALAIWITNIDNINEFDHNMTRYEMALMLYRMRPIMENSQMKTMALNAIAGIKQSSSGTIDSQTVIDNLWTLVWWIDASTDPELLEAIYWMSDNGLTIYKTVAEYKPFETLNRAWAAKIFDKFSDMLWLGKNQGFLQNECNFKDIAGLDIETQNHIVNVCKKWLIKWSNWLFNPNSYMNKSTFIVALIRMFEWKALDETTTPWWKNYFDKAQELWLVTAADSTTFDTPISRYEVALFLYKFNIRYKMLNNLNNNKISDDVINTVEWSVTTLNWKSVANIYINTSLLKQWTLDVWYIETFGTRSKIVKVQERTESNVNWFIWYGDVFDIATDGKIWTITFMVQNGFVLEWTVRLTDKTYKITPVKWTNAYYQITQI